MFFNRDVTIIDPPTKSVLTKFWVSGLSGTTKEDDLIRAFSRKCDCVKSCRLQRMEKSDVEGGGANFEQFMYKQTFEATFGVIELSKPLTVDACVTCFVILFS